MPFCYKQLDDLLLHVMAQPFTLILGPFIVYNKENCYICQMDLTGIISKNETWLNCT